MYISAHQPTRTLTQLSPLKPAVSKSVETENGPADSVDITPAPPQRQQGDKLARQGSSTARRVLGVIGLGLVAFSLAGCNLGGGEPTPTPPNQNQQQNQGTAKTLTARLEQLRSQSDRTGYNQMAEAGYQRAVLERFASNQNPALAPVRELAQKGLEAFDHNGDPATQQKAMHEVMQAIANLQSEAPEVVSYTQAAAASLQTGELFMTNVGQAPGGIVGQVKSRAYEEAFKALLQRLQQAPDQLKGQSGYDPAVIRNYVESLSIGPQIALDYAAQLGDPGVASILYSSVGDVSYQRIKTDGGVLGTQVTQAMELIQSLRKQFGF